MIGSVCLQGVPDDATEADFYTLLAGDTLTTWSHCICM